MAVAAVYEAINQKLASDMIGAAADRASAIAPRCPWPQLLGALGLVMSGDLNGAIVRLDLAKALGAPESVWRCLTGIAGKSGVSSTDIAGARLRREVLAIVQFACSEEPEALRIEAFIRGVGEHWVETCPVEPAVAARKLMAAYCGEGKWADATAFADQLERFGRDWAIELATVARVRQALDQALRGDLEGADQDLRSLEKRLSQTTSRAGRSDSPPTNSKE